MVFRKLRYILPLFISIFSFSLVSCNNVNDNEINNNQNNNDNNNENNENSENNEGNNSENSENTENEEAQMMYINVNNHTLEAKLEDNSSSEALVELLKEKDLVIEMSDYGNFEKVGPIGTTLPRNDTRITTTYGDIILYQGNQITIYYDTNTWTFTKLGKIQNITQQELKDILGSGDCTVTFSLNK